MIYEYRKGFQLGSFYFYYYNYIFATILCEMATQFPLSVSVISNMMRLEIQDILCIFEYCFR